MAVHWLAAAWLLGLELEAQPIDPFAENFTLLWEAPGACPDEAAIRAAVQTRSAVGAGISGHAGLEVRAQVQQDAARERYRLELAVRAGDGRSQSHADAPDCAVLADLVAFKIAVALREGVATGRADAPGPAPPDSPETSVVTVEPRPKPRATAPGPDLAKGVRVALAPPQRWRPQVHAATQLRAGWLGSASAGVDLAASIHRRAASFGIVASVWPHTVASARLEGAGAEFFVAGAGVQACAGWGRRRWDAQGCLGFEVGGVDGRGVGTDVVVRQRRPYALVPVRGRLRVGLRGPWFAFVGAGAAVGVVRPSFSIARVEVARMSAVAGEVSAGAGVRWR